MSADNQIKKIIIIGATSGIGRKMAELYAAAGNIVGITGRRKKLLDDRTYQNVLDHVKECESLKKK